MSKISIKKLYSMTMALSTQKLTSEINADNQLCFITAVGLITGTLVKDKGNTPTQILLENICDLSETSMEESNLEYEDDVLHIKDVNIISGNKEIHLESMLLFTSDIIGITYENCSS